MPIADNGFLAVVGLSLVMAASSQGLRAEPLAKEACDVIKAEHAALEAAGLADTLKRGAAWGRANLTAAKLKEVERYIGLEEQLQFRCGLARLRVLPGAEGEETGDPDKAADKPAAETAAPAAAISPGPKPKPKPKATVDKAAVDKTAADKTGAKGVAPAADVAATAENAQPAPKAKPKPKPKPKADDAFKPPPAAKE